MLILMNGVPLGDMAALNFSGAGETISATPGPDSVATITIAATGDVVGPAVAVASDIALFNGVTGKLIKDSAVQISTTTPSVASDNTKVPTSGAVWTAISGAVAGLLDLRGNYDASTNLFPAAGGSGTAGAVLKGDTWYVSVAGVLGGVAVEIGDVVFALADAPGQVAASWSILNVNIGAVGTMAAQNANNVAITGGSVTGITDLTVADGGTGSSTAAGALANLGAQAAGALYSNFVQLAGAGNWLVPAGVTRIQVAVLCGGGGGGGVANAAASAAGGVAGESTLAYMTVVPGALIAYSVGAAGAGGAAGNNNGAAGGATTFGTITNLVGGPGGAGSAVGNAAAATATALAALRVYVAPTSTVSNTVAGLGGASGGATAVGGIGSGSIYGVPGFSPGANSAGGNAQGFGAGGAGATSSAGGAFAGGNGAAGTIIILY